jgi:TatA/E family protein of Tat protein translocase
MFGSLGMPELILILVIALIVFGPKKLPEVGRSLGKAMREFKRTTEEIKGKFEEQINAEEFKDIKNDLADIKREVSGTFELPNEIKELTRDLNAPLDAPPSAPPDTAPPQAVSSPPAPQIEPPAPAEQKIAPAPQDAAKDGTTHGEG